MQRTAGGRRSVGWAAVAVLALVAVARALREPLAVPTPSITTFWITAGQDFRDATYFPVRELLAGGNPYDPDVMLRNWPVWQEFDLYAPMHLLLHLPFGLLPYRTALALYSVLGIGLLAAIGVVSVRALHPRASRLVTCAVAAGVVASEPGKSAIHLGQVNSLVGLGGVLALTGAGRRPGWAAVGLALAWIKPQFGLPLTLILLARGCWRPAAFGTGLCALLSLPVAGVLVARAGGLGGFLRVVQANLDYATHTQYGAVDSPDGGRVDVAAVFYRLTGLLPPGAELVVLVVVLGLTCWLVSGRSRRGEPFDPRELLLAALGVLLCIVHQQRETLIAIPGLVGVAGLWLDAGASGLRPHHRGGPAPSLALGLAALLAAVPSVHLSLVQNVIIAVAGTRVDGLVEGVALLIAFVLVCAVSHRDRPAVIMQSRGDHALLAPRSA